jgi:superfamily II DNA or RNA helicase
MKSLKNRLLSLGVTAEILKATTPKNEREEIKRKYENGEIRVLIGGVVLEASLSLYRASVGINMTLSTSSNSSTQFLGRLDRYDASIDNHEKIFIDLVYGHKNYSAFLKRWESFKNLNLKKPKKFFEAKGFDILSAFKDIDFKAYLNKKQE